MWLISSNTIGKGFIAPFLMLKNFTIIIKTYIKRISQVYFYLS
jgi:hypothetical protein